MNVTRLFGWYSARSQRLTIFNQRSYFLLELHCYVTYEYNSHNTNNYQNLEKF